MKHWKPVPGVLSISILLMVTAMAADAGKTDAPKARFTAGPEIKKHGETYGITFAVSAPIDATVAIVDPDGRVVRHLAAGMLGKNPPEPLQAGLNQTIDWNGLDDKGKPVPPGSKLRVSLGLTAEFARILCPAPVGVASRGPIGLAVDGKGNLIVTEGSLFVGHVTTIVTTKAFDSEGRYQRTIMPFRGDWPEKKVSMVDFITTTGGRRVPLSGPNNHRPYSGFVPGHPGMVRTLPVITDDGRMLFGARGAGRILSVGIDGSCPRELYNGPRPPIAGRTFFLALSPGDKFLYVSGVGGSKQGPRHAVYRVALDAWGDDLKPFIGDEDAAGTGENHFNDPRGIDVDSAGRLYVGDYMNDRVQVFDCTGTFVKSLAVTGPEQVRVHPKTGAVYVLSVRDRGKTDHYGNEATWEVYQDKSVIKFASIDDWKEVARVDLPNRRKHMHDAGPMMVLDATHEEPALWIANVGRQEPDDMLWKVADRGEKLEKVPHGILRLNRYQTVDPPLAADRGNNELYAFGTPVGHVRIDPVTGETKKLELEGEVGKAALTRVGYAAVGPDGSLYLRSGNPDTKATNPWLIRRFDRGGRNVPFKTAGESIPTRGRKQGGSPEHPSSFSVGPDGKLYVVAMLSRKDMTALVDLYGPDGAPIQKGLVPMTANPGAVRVDPAGRLYVSDTVRPKDKQFPDMYPSDPRTHLCKWYGTVFRFPPEGGSIKPSDKTAMTHFARRNAPVEVKGAQWGFYGISPMPQQAGCLCVIADFDVDGWGRVFVPDVPGYCVAVLDANGNVLTRFGSYGNRDALGAGSAVPEPPIPLWFPVRVAALDGDAFVVDSHNSRIVQVRLTGAVTKEVPVPLPVE